MSMRIFVMIKRVYTVISLAYTHTHVMIKRVYTVISLACIHAHTYPVMTLSIPSLPNKRKPCLLPKNIYIFSLPNTGWRRLIGSPKLQIIFNKRATKYRSLLMKMTYKDKRSYESLPPCNEIWETEQAFSFAKKRNLEGSFAKETF